MTILKLRYLHEETQKAGRRKLMAYERENLIEKHLVAEVKKAGGVAFKFVSPVAARYQIALFCYPAVVSFSLNVNPPASHHGLTSCANTDGCARWALP